GAETEVAVQQRRKRRGQLVVLRVPWQRPAREHAPVGRARMLAHEPAAECRGGWWIVTQPDARAPDGEFVTAVHQVAQQAAPEERDHGAGTVVRSHARSSGLYRAAPEYRRGRPGKRALRVKPSCSPDAFPGQHAVGADDIPGGGLAHEEMIAVRVEAIDVETGLRALDPRPELVDEDPPAEPLRRSDVTLARGQGHGQGLVG